MTTNKTDWLKSKPIAHRGLHSNDNIVPENSLKAFERAVEEKYPIELDVYLLTDNKIAVFHDDSLMRMCGYDVLIQNLTSKQLNEYQLLNSSEKIPLLDEVFALVQGQVPILIEIKDQKRKKEVQQILFEAINLYQGEIAIQSFNPFLLKWFVRHAPSIPRGQLSSDFKNEKMNLIVKKLLKHFLLNFISRPHFIAYDIQDMPNNTVQKLRNRGLPVLCWTIKKASDYAQVLPFCDNIIFEGFKP